MMPDWESVHVCSVWDRVRVLRCRPGVVILKVQVQKLCNLVGGGKVSNMKRIRLLVLAGVIAAALPFGITSVGATGSTGSTTSVTIRDRADYDFVGTTIDVGLYVRCSGGSGSVIVNLNQYPPETPYPVATGSGPQIVACNGQTHSVAVTVGGFGFDAGRAKATATVTAPSGNKTVVKWITIVQ
jgi:hypothetical protein